MNESSRRNVKLLSRFLTSCHDDRAWQAKENATHDGADDDVSKQVETARFHQGSGHPAGFRYKTPSGGRVRQSE